MLSGNSNSGNSGSSSLPAVESASAPHASQAAAVAAALQRAPMSAAAKISRLVDELFLPMALESGGEDEGPFTCFLSDTEADEQGVVARLCELRPWLMEDRMGFVGAAGELYDRYHASRSLV